MGRNHENSRDESSKTEPKNANPFRDRFRDYAVVIDKKNDKFERLVKASRDVTMQSKKIIFELHRLTEKNKEQILGKATKSSDRVRREIARRIASEITTENYYRFHRAFTPGLQEYIEARTFLSYCSSGTVIPRDDIQRELIETCDEEKVTGSLHINASDYLLGIADLTGELMRMALGGQTGDAVLIRAAMAEIEHAMAELSGSHRIARDMPSKMNVLRQSVVKVERACFDKAVRAAEMPGGSKGRSVKRGITDVDDTVRVQVAKKPKQEA